MTQLPASEEYQPTAYYHWGQGQPQEHLVGTSCDNLVGMGAQQAQVSKGGRLPFAMPPLPPPVRAHQWHRSTGHNHQTPKRPAPVGHGNTALQHSV